MMTLPPEGIIICDDDPKTSLKIFFGGNGDWYVTILTEERPRLADAVRFRMSGSSQHDAVGVVIAALHSIATGEDELAISRLKSAIELVNSERQW